MTFLRLVPTGMSDPEEPVWGSWGGRYGLNPAEAGRPYYWANQRDTWQRTTSRDNTLARWAAAIQHDFAARADWCVADDFDKANHAPLAVLNGDRTRRILRLDAKGGESVRLSAAGSSDPDGDALVRSWFTYPEAGTPGVEAGLSSTDGETTTLVAPKVREPAKLHVILQLEDSGSPSLFVVSPSRNPRAAVKRRFSFCKKSDKD